MRAFRVQPTAANMDEPYTVAQQEVDGEMVYSVWRRPWIRCISRKPLSHDEAVLLCERLNREAETT